MKRFWESDYCSDWVGLGLVAWMSGAPASQTGAEAALGSRWDYRTCTSVKPGNNYVPPRLHEAKSGCTDLAPDMMKVALAP
jgi:hypothetical protein